MKTYILLFLLILVIGGALMCATPQEEDLEVVPIKDLKGNLFAGAETCVTCHQEIHNLHQNTAHAQTSSLATRARVNGSFDSGHNKFQYNPRLKVVMQQERDSLFQVAYIDEKEAFRKSMDIIVGSGRRGQTYIYWEGDYLFQLPVSHITNGDRWMNSPGYPPDKVVFDRSIVARCLECHVTNASVQYPKDEPNTYNRHQMLYGITCEKCHGPGQNHVKFHSANPNETKPKYIKNPAQFSRSAQLDACALCHSGLRNNIREPFSFEVGNKLADFLAPGYSPDTLASLDVHSNQYGLLAASKCFTSNLLTCTTCHDVHQTQRNQPAIFSAKCMNCHQVGKQPLCSFDTRGTNIILEKNCIDCHMPSLPTKQIVFDHGNGEAPTQNYMRTHHIKIY